MLLKIKGDFDIKDVNLNDKQDEEQNLDYQLNIELNNNPKLKNISNELTTYKQLDEAQLKPIIELIAQLDEKFKLYNLEFDKLDDEYLSAEILKQTESNKKHLRQISSIVSHVGKLVEQDEEDEESSCCLVELGAGRGKLSYWFDQSRRNSELQLKNKFNIILIERGSQRYKFDGLLKQTVEDTNSEFERIRIDLKDIYLNKVPLIQKSSKYILYGKHLCGCATDFALRSLKNSLEDTAEKKIKFSGFVLAVCCHHKCEWDSFCGRQFLKKIGINSKLFYILRSISSWAVCGENNTTPPPGM